MDTTPNIKEGVDTNHYNTLHYITYITYTHILLINNVNTGHPICYWYHTRHNIWTLNHHTVRLCYNDHDKINI